MIAGRMIFSLVLSVIPVLIRRSGFSPEVIRHQEKGLDAEGIIYEMILLEREPDGLKIEFADTVSAIQKI
jgi:hypothetical protein